MRTIAIDFNNPIEYENMVIGNIGEHNATEIILTPPSKIADCEAVKSYIVAFVVGGMVIHSEPFSKTETLSVKLWKQLTEEPVMGIQLEAYDENENFIGKSELISSLRLSPSACGNDTVADTDNPDILSAIAANTSARHSHSNKSVLDRITRANMEDVAANTLARHTHSNTETLDKLGETNGNLTYKGREVGSGGSGGSGGKEEIYIGSGEMPEGYVLQIDPEGTADTIPTKTSQLINDSGFITVKDLPADELPSVTEADNGKVLRVVNGVWAADTIQIEQNKSNWELITEVTLDTSTAKYILCSCDEYDKIEIMIKRDSNNTSLTGNMIFEIVDSNGNSVVELYSNNIPGNREKLTIMEVNSGYAHSIMMTTNNFYAQNASLSRGYYVGNGCKYCLKIPKPDTACDGLSTMTVIGRRR